MDFDGLVVADRSERGKLRVSGEQRLWFLHQILTQAFEDMVPGDARDAAMITAHGRMIGYLECLATDDAVLCHFEAELCDELPGALSRYLLATRAAVDDVGDELGLVLVGGEGWRAAAEAAAPGAPLHPTRSLGAPAGYVWLDAAAVARVVDDLRARGARPASEDELEAVRVANGIPRWGRDMGAKTIPQEAGVDAVAVHYDKGCYVGQEAMAKIHLRGKVNRRLRKLEGSAALDAGAEVVVDGAAAGTVTSAHGTTALAMLRHTVEPGALVRAGDVEARVVG